MASRIRTTRDESINVLGAHHFSVRVVAIDRMPEIKSGRYPMTAFRKHRWTMNRRRFLLWIISIAALAACSPAPTTVPTATQTITEDQAATIAQQFLQEKHLDWGQPIKVEHGQDKDGRYIFEYFTPYAESTSLGPRAVLVFPDGKAMAAPRG
jgi:hypothetical protein